MTNVISMSEWKAGKAALQPAAPVETREQIGSPRVGSSAGYLEISLIKSRKKCHCCGQRKTHNVSNNGVALASGCLPRCEKFIKDAIKRSGGV
jgi:hypothetical protein